MKKRNQILLLTFLMFFTIPPAGFLVCYYSGIWPGQLIPKLLDNPSMGIFTIFYLSGVWIYSNKKLKAVDAFLEKPDATELVRIQKIISRFPITMLFAVGVFTIFGCSSSMMFQSFVTKPMFILAECNAVSLLFLLSIPFFIKMLYMLDEYTGSIPIPEKRIGLNYKARSYITFFATTFGSILLVAAVALSVVYSAKGNSGNLLNELTVKIVPVIVISVIIVFINIAMLGNNFSRVLNDATQFATEISNNNLTIDKLLIRSRDEVGLLTAALNRMKENLQDVIKDIVKGGKTVNEEVVELLSVSDHMAQSSQELSTQSNLVATGAEEMDSTTTSIAASMEEASSNVEIVAAAAEQMSSTVNEISDNTGKARSITSEAVSRAGKASEQINKLGDAALKIGMVTETITEISEQTNLLALNATIEAARAGEAGKGFAVVANEIKELARQTAEATRDIKEKIESIQGSTSGAVKQVENISDVIHEVNQIVSTIAAAVEEQSVTTKEIATNVSQTALGIQEVNANVAQSSTVAGEIAKDIARINQSAKGMASSSEKVNKSAQELSGSADQMKQTVVEFKL